MKIGSIKTLIEDLKLHRGPPDPDPDPDPQPDPDPGSGNDGDK